MPAKFHSAGTSNLMTYTVPPRLPTPNKRAQPKLTTGFGKFYGQTSYGSNFVDGHDESYREKFKIEKARIKEQGMRARQGSFSPIKPRQLPNIVVTTTNA